MPGYVARGGPAACNCTGHMAGLQEAWDPEAGLVFSIISCTEN